MIPMGGSSERARVPNAHRPTTASRAFRRTSMIGARDTSTTHIRAHALRSAGTAARVRDGTGAKKARHAQYTGAPSPSVRTTG